MTIDDILAMFPSTKTDLQTYLLILACIIGAVIALVQIVKEARITRAENELRGWMRVNQERLDIDAAEEWLKVTPVCPDCKTSDGRRRDPDGSIILVQECMEVRYVYCHDIWHSAFHKGCGTYGGKTPEQAKIEIGRRLRRA